MKFWAKSHHGGLLAACDEDLLGRKFEAKGAVFDVSRKFYGGKLVDEDELGRMLAEARSANIAGKSAVLIAKRQGLISCTRSIGGVEYAIVVKV